MKRRHNKLRPIMSIIQHRSLFVLIIFAITISAQSSNRNWEDSDNGKIKWSENCEFVGGDFENRKGVLSLTTCEDICLANKHCTHFTFNFYGTCFLKVLEPGDLEKGFSNAYFNPFCGYVIDRVNKK